MQNRIAQYLSASSAESAEPAVSKQVLHGRKRTRLDAFRDAWNGLSDAWGSEPHLRLHVWIAAIVIGFGIWCSLSLLEWLWVFFAIGLVIFAELMNTAIEQMVDLVIGMKPDSLARQVKDMAAGCVLVAALIAVVIGGFTFGPYLLGG